MAELKFLSLGWGVQSFTIAAMIALEELAPVDLAIHADTTHEAEGTYRHAEKYTPWLESRGLKVVTVTAKRAELVREDWGTGSVMVPAFSREVRSALWTLSSPRGGGFIAWVRPNVGTPSTRCTSLPPPSWRRSHGPAAKRSKE